MVVRVMSYKVLAFGLSDIGLVRQNNEDAWGAVPEMGFFVLADGMGGHRAGEVASRECVAQLCRIVRKQKSRPKMPLKESIAFLREAIAQVNELIFTMGRTDKILQGMGTTLCCIQFHEEGVIFAHIGDSRIYRLSENKLGQQTSDHSLMRELIDLGQLSEGQAPEFMYKNIITRAVGTEPTIEPTICVNEVVDQDTYLMCSDGLSDMLTSSEIEEILKKNKSAAESAKELINAAKEKGGYDNVTVVLVRIKEINDAKDLS